MKDKEQIYLRTIQEKIQTEIAGIESTIKEKEKYIVQIKKHYWEKLIEINELSYEAKMDRKDIDLEVTLAHQKLDQLRIYEKMWNSPYFAKVDFIYEGEEEVESFYIGMASFYPSWSTIPLIFDWRAPIASLFYDYDTGNASFIAPIGIIHGDIQKKMQYKITKGELEYYFENEIKIDDDILKKALGNKSNESLRSIVTTIQKEQNKIIRNTKDRVLVVQGCAGSGKTSIALHRIAYLLYHKRKELTAKNILILSPNAIFSEYISQILPELGEENIVEISFDTFAKKELKDICTFENRFDNIESLLLMKEGTINREKRVKREKRKLSKDFVHGLEKYVVHMETTIVNYKELKVKNISRSKEDIKVLFEQKFTKIPLLNRLGAVAEFIIDEEETLAGTSLDPIIVEVIKDKVKNMYFTQDVLRIYNKFLDYRGEAVLDIKERHINYEDVYPLLYMKYLLYGKEIYSHIKHLVVDEMQDYSYLQYVLLKKLFPCTMTILGDREQVASDENSQILSILQQVFQEEINTVTLTKCYRSTYEIGKFAGDIIQQSGIEYVERHGKEVEVTLISSKKEQIIELQKRLHKQSEDSMEAIVCRTRKEAVDLYQDLKEDKRISLIVSEEDELKRGVAILPFYLAKGLEFDVVHIPNIKSEYYQSPIHRQILYIACTRALHELYLYEVV